MDSWDSYGKPAVSAFSWHYLCVCLLRTAFLKAVKGKVGYVLSFLGIKQAVTGWIYLMLAVKILKGRYWTEYYPSSPFFVFFTTCLKTKRNFVGSPRHLSDSYLSSCLLNSLSLSPIWERYTSTVTCTGKKHLPMLWNRHSGKKTVNILNLILGLFSLKI